MPQWTEATVDERKIVDYLLATDHPVGGGKAAFFRAVGYTSQDWTQLRDDLVTLARRGQRVAEHETKFGHKYVVDGAIQSPTGQTISVRTVWISDHPGGPPRLITAYPN